jgi:hypothetical protein
MHVQKQKKTSNVQLPSAGVAKLHPPTADQDWRKNCARVETADFADDTRFNQQDAEAEKEFINYGISALSA